MILLAYWTFWLAWSAAWIVAAVHSGDAGYLTMIPAAVLLILSYMWARDNVTLRQLRLASVAVFFAGGIGLFIVFLLRVALDAQ